MQLKPVIAAVALAMTASAAQAKDIIIDGENKGSLDLMVKAMTVLDGKQNGFDPNYGTTEVLKAKYTSPSWNGVKFVGAWWMDGDLLNTNDSTPTGKDKLARGMYTDNNAEAQGLVGEFKLEGNYGQFGWFAGRTELKTPMTYSSEAGMPSFFGGFGVNYKIDKGFKVGLTQITHIALGARTATEWGIIGEGTGTGGTVIDPRKTQAEFIKIADATIKNNTDSTNGITALNAAYTLSPSSNLTVWNYYADDISNNFYAEVDQKFKLAGKSAIKFQGQYLNQNEVGKELAGKLDFDMFGVKAAYMNPVWSTFIAANRSCGDTAMLNAWGGDPAYTSSVFSRNAYREDVTAFKIGGQYKITPKWILGASYANYGQSNTSTATLTPTTDAKEADFSVTWKFNKQLTFKAFLAERTSEYDTATTDRTQSHSRLVAIWKY